MVAAVELNVLCLCGSLRAGSYNRMALAAAHELAPPGMNLQDAEIGDIPPYNDDVRARGYPAPTQRLRAEIAAADALLFVTPEYNYSVPGVLKNAIDWASRPPDQPFNRKPAAIMGASTGGFGTARGQHHLRQICVFLNVLVLAQPEVMIPQTHTKFDDQGRLADEATRRFIGDLLHALAAWTLRLRTAT